MKSILKNIFENNTEGFEYQFVGNNMVIILDDVRRIEVRFCDTNVSKNYNAILLILSSKINGELNRNLVKFSDIFSCMKDLTHTNKLEKYIWSDSGYAWYGEPTKEDIIAMQNTLKNYITLWK